MPPIQKKKPAAKAVAVKVVYADPKTPVQCPGCFHTAATYASGKRMCPRLDCKCVCDDFIKRK